MPLDGDVRRDMEHRFGRDFSAVRVHADEAAARNARRSNSIAATTGHEVAFAAGYYAPATAAGRQLIAHELTHVAQADGAGTAQASASSAAELEREAHRSAVAYAEGRPIPPVLAVAARTSVPLRVGPDDPNVPTFGNLPLDAPAKGVGPKRVELIKVDGNWYESPPGRGISRASGTYDFVVQEGRIWAVKASGPYGHTEAAQGGRVSYAGQIEFGGPGGTRGVITRWSNASGHYAASRTFAESNAAKIVGLPMDKFQPYTGERAERGPQLPTYPPRGLPSTTTGSSTDDAATAGASGTGGAATKAQTAAGSPKVGTSGVQPGVVNEEAAVPRPTGGAWKGVALQTGVAAAVMVLQAVVTAELDRQWIEDGLAAKWPDVQRQIAAASEQIQALKARSETEKVYAVLDVATYKMRQIPPPGALVTFDSAPVVERVTLAAISAAPRQVAPHSVAPSNNLTAGTILESAFTFSVQVWSRAEEAEQARTRERTQITDRLRQLSKQDAPPSTGTTATTPTTTTPSTGGPSLLPPVAQDAPSLLPGAPGEGPIQQAARSVEGARQAGLHLEREGAALLARIGSGPSPSAEERASFLRSEERWRLGVRYLINWYTKESREEAVQALKQLLGDDKMSGPKLQQLRTQLGG